jgi:hypothetical protein
MTDTTQALEVFLGEWEVVSVLADGTRATEGTSTFEWIGDGAFLLQRGTTEVTDAAPQIWHDNAPRSSTAVIGADDRTGTYVYAYADSRDVHRVHQMTLEDGEWRIFGQAGPDFHQRFVGSFSADGNRIDGRWERSSDGKTWEPDFEGSYTRIR